MSITNRITGPLYGERIKNILMDADHEYKRLANTSTSLLELLPPHYDLSSMFSYEQKGIVFRIKLIKPEIKISRHQLLFSTHFLEPEFLHAYKEHLSKVLHKTIKHCVKKYSQKINFKHSILKHISESTRNTSRYALHGIINKSKYHNESIDIKERIENEILLDKLTLNSDTQNITTYLKDHYVDIIKHISNCAKEIVSIGQKERYIFNNENISGRRPNITGTLLCLSELIDCLKIDKNKLDNISNAIILNVVYSTLQQLTYGINPEQSNTIPTLNISSPLIAPHIFYLAKHKNSSQYKYIEKEYLLGQLLTFLMYKTAYYAMHKINVSHKYFYNDINNELPIDELKDKKLFSRNFMRSTDVTEGIVVSDTNNHTVDGIETDIKEISTLINQRKALFFSF
ncbi:hypothetical protein ACNJKD_13470 [Edwardsiella tarda]|uniref:hypothetical protein n=1 Tax=Edwardsiella tarda TaxID=636 RepID=UPI003A892C97